MTDMDLTLFRWALASATTIILGLIGLVFNLLRNNNKISNDRNETKIQNVEDKLSSKIDDNVAHLAKTIGMRLDHFNGRLDDFEKHQKEFRDVRHEDRDLISKLVPAVELMSTDYKDLLERIIRERDITKEHLKSMNMVNSELKGFIREKVK